jgi:hypothetical protein
MPDDIEGGTGGGEGKGGAAGDVQQQLSALTAKLAAAELEGKSLKDAKADLEQRLDEADKELLSDDFLDWKESKAKGGGKSGGEKGGTSGEGIDLDRASNREIVDFIEKKYKGDVDAAVSAIKKEQDLTRQQIGLLTAQFDVALTSLRHDGRDGKPSWKSSEKEIFEVAKANPKWDAERCYQQFLLQSKAAADEREKAEREKAEEEEKAATERAGVPSSITQGKQLTKEEAAEIAYRKAFGTKNTE